MRLQIMLPYKTILERTIYKITAPGIEGQFQVLPKHMDGTWILKAGVLVIGTSKDSDKELYFAISQGVLVKEGGRLYLSCFQAIKGDSLETLSQTVRKDLETFDESEKKAKQALHKLETDTVKRFMNFNK